MRQDAPRGLSLCFAVQSDPPSAKTPFFTICYDVRRGRQVALPVAETSRILHFWVFWGYLAHAWKIDQKVFQGPKFDARTGFFGHGLIK